MNNPIVCPECGGTDMVGRVEIVERCVDLETGTIVRDEVVESHHRYECGACGCEWPRRTPIAYR